MYEHRYGEKEREGNGWRSPRLFNWYDWKIASPEMLIQTLIILGEKVSVEERRKYLSLFDSLVPRPTDYASNKVHFGKLIIGSGLLQENEERIRTAISGIEDTHLYVDGWKNDGQGFYTDGSYIFHTRHPMNGSYARGHFAALISICRIFRGTKFADHALAERLCDWANNTFLPFISKTVMARSVICRHPNAGRGAGLATLSNICELAAFAEESRAAGLFLHVKRNLQANPEMKNPEILTGFLSELSWEACNALREVLDSDTAAAAYNLNKVFHNEDRVVHHFGGVSYCLAMSSSRIYNYESINHENMDGWYLGDGMLTAYGEDFYAYSNGWPQSNPYRRPGTTADTRERAYISISQANEYLSSQDFVGGVSDGICGAAAMRLESYHGDGEHKSKRFFSPDGAYGGPSEKRDCSLLARKAWFFFDKIAICLGSDISAHDDANVLTVIDSRRTASPLMLPGKGEFPLTDVDRALPENTDCLFMEGFGGYYFPQMMCLLARRHEADVPFTEIVAEHGVNPVDASYAYALLPDLTEEETAAFARNPGFSILANNKELQAVRYADGRAAYIFWKAGSFDDITVSAPMAVLLSGGRIYVSDPTQKRISASLSVAGREFSFDFSRKYGATLSAAL
ncbi:MAG: hypothetical protein IKB22_01860, partial [Lentisphaeria bacterium]|nr:hypothetical protein [Lentisphaeria bacterium]